MALMIKKYEVSPAFFKLFPSIAKIHIFFPQK